MNVKIIKLFNRMFAPASLEYILQIEVRKKSGKTLDLKENDGAL